MRMTGTPLVLAKRSRAEAHSRTWAMEPAEDSTSSVEMVWMESTTTRSGWTSLMWSKMASREFSDFLDVVEDGFEGVFGENEEAILAIGY